MNFGQELDIHSYAYSGWNTNGNTLGTAISNLLLLHLFKAAEENALFNRIRLTEDFYYQTKVRTGYAPKNK